jgi:hypothetical protein
MITVLKEVSFKNRALNQVSLKRYGELKCKSKRIFFEVIVFSLPVNTKYSAILI